MKCLKKITLLLLIVSLQLTFWHCTKYKEPVPFFDGMFLEYSSGHIQKIYNFQELEDLEFKIIKTEKMKALGDSITNFLVDIYGKVYESSTKGYEGKFSPIWIPVNLMEIGDSFDGKYTVLRRDRYRKWDVLVIKAIEFNVEHYFEINTGYLVGVKGIFGRAFEYFLVNTNADIPVAE